MPKARALSPLVQEVMDYLADGEEHPFEDIIEEVGPTIPPGQAFRIAEQSRASTLKAMGKEDKPRSREKTKAEIISAGRRRMMWSCLWSLQKRGKIVMNGKGPDKKVRLT